MKKQDMIDKIMATFEYVEGINERNLDTIYTGQTRQVYLAPVFVPQDEKVIEKTFKFIVFDEGEAGEEAFWLSADPAPPVPEPTWADNCLAWLRGLVGDGTILHVHSLVPDNATRRATATIVLDIAGTKTEQRYAVWQDVQDEWQYEKLVSA